VRALEAAQLAHECPDRRPWRGYRIGTAVLAPECGCADANGVPWSDLHGLFPVSVGRVQQVDREAGWPAAPI